ncbi:MAG TPA: hypothetical protein DHW15_05250 [Bacteroidetes bacterium]|jgi:hypothetical protein|nr:MAG: hypothetical protein ABR94_11870 [Sphingobacteriales bacterium BACL12 MAG-120802-bin5]KRP13884.1 MAG: hypothetical protein ABR95_05265 [Sphingobacteriales bacterium BACL12 MAG-120813-bin55]HCK21569.1 hypothetical protein [Bacteroidota bacterium]
MIVAITELRIRSIWMFPLFMARSAAAVSQAQKEKGLLSFSAKVRWNVAYTLTSWTDENSMLVYKKNGAHKRAMKDTKKVSHQYRSVYYEAETVPSWKEALQRLEHLHYKFT